MKLSKIFIIFTFLFAFAFNASAQNVRANKIKFSAADKKEILRQVFDDGFEKLISDEKFALCTIPIVNDKKIILVRIESEKASIFPNTVGEYRLKFLTKKEIESEIKSNNGDCFFELNTLHVENSTKAKVTLWRWINVITVINGKSWYPSRWVGATGLVYEATKINRKWQVRFLNGTAVVSSIYKVYAIFTRYEIKFYCSES